MGAMMSGPVSHVVGTNTICSYTATGSTSGNFLVQFNSDMSPANFAAAKAAASVENPTAVTGIGDQAYSTTVGAGSFAMNSLQVIKGNKGLLISGPVTLTQIEAFANQLLPKL